MSYENINRLTDDSGPRAGGSTRRPASPGPLHAALV